MPEAMLTNPAAALAVPSDYTTYKDKDGNLIQYGQTVKPFRANDTIAKWAPVALVAATATVPMSVENLDISDAFAGLMFIGVAQEAGVAGDIISVCTEGVTLVKCDTGDPVFGDVVIKGASDGTVTTAGTAGGTWDASDVAGTAFGVFLDVEDASDFAPMYVHKF